MTGPKQADDVREDREAGNPGRHFFAAARRRRRFSSPFQHEDAFACTGQIRRAHEAVVARADDPRIVVDLAITLGIRPRNARGELLVNRKHVAPTAMILTVRSLRSI